MGIIVIGPHPQAEIVKVTHDNGSETYNIVDGSETLGIYPRRSHAEACLPLIQSGE